jgi:hypothetical protein
MQSSQSGDNPIDSADHGISSFEVPNSRFYIEGELIFIAVARVGERSMANIAASPGVGSRWARSGVSSRRRTPIARGSWAHSTRGDFDAIICPAFPLPAVPHGGSRPQWSSLQPGCRRTSRTSRSRRRGRPHGLARRRAVRGQTLARGCVIGGDGRPGDAFRRTPGLPSESSLRRVGTPSAQGLAYVSVPMIVGPLLRWARRAGRRGGVSIWIQPRSARELAATMDELASPIAAFLRDAVGDEHSFGRDLHAAMPGLATIRPRTALGRFRHQI